jgi:hypothetical protein
VDIITALEGAMGVFTKPPLRDDEDEGGDRFDWSARAATARCALCAEPFHRGSVTQEVPVAMGSGLYHRDCRQELGSYIAQNARRIHLDIRRNRLLQELSEVERSLAELPAARVP